MNFSFDMDIFNWESYIKYYLKHIEKVKAVDNLLLNPNIPIISVFKELKSYTNSESDSESESESYSKDLSREQILSKYSVKHKSLYLIMSTSEFVSSKYSYETNGTIYRNPNLSFEFIMNSSITYELLNYILLCNHEITEENIISIFYKYFELSMGCTNSLCHNNSPLISFQFLYEHRFVFGLSPFDLSWKANIQNIRENSNYNWNWNSLSYSSNITSEDILNNLQYPWDFKSIQFNRNLTIEMYLYLKSINIKINCFFYPNLSRSNYIDIQDVISNPDIPWDYSNLSMNPNITWKVISAHSDIPWNYDDIVYNDMSEPLKYSKLKKEYSIMLKELLY